MCMIFYRRDTHIAEVQMGVPAARLEDACTADNFDINKLPYITLVGRLLNFCIFWSVRKFECFHWLSSVNKYSRHSRYARMPIDWIVWSTLCHWAAIYFDTTQA